MTPTAEIVETAVRDYQAQNPDQSELTLDQLIELLDPQTVGRVKGGEAITILWAEHASNILKQLGRDGQLVIRLTRDDRGYESPVVILSRA